MDDHMIVISQQWEFPFWLNLIFILKQIQSGVNLWAISYEMFNLQNVSEK